MKLFTSPLEYWQATALISPTGGLASFEGDDERRRKSF
jgi:hypothetical protein